jgi:hypothetical protein
MGSIMPGVLRGEPCGTHRLVLASLAAQRPAAVPACLPPSWRPPWSEENRSRAGNRPPAVPAFAMWLLVLKVADGPASPAAPPRAIGIDRQLGQQCCPTRRTCQNSATDTRVCHLKYAAGRHLVAADPLAAQSIEQKKHYRATRLRANGADGGPKTRKSMPPFLRTAARPKCGLSTGRLHVFCE